MKLKNLSIAFVTLFSVWQTSPAFAQPFHFPSTTDIFMANVGIGDTSINVTNTAAQDIVPGVSDLQVVVWDGQDPMFGWDRDGVTGLAAISGTQLGTVSRPDIVLNPAAAVGSERALIVYLMNTEVYYEVHEWTGTTFSLVVGPHAISGTSGSTHPNVDVIRDGRAAIVWSNGGAVYAKGYKIPTDTLSGNILLVSKCATNNGYTYCDRSDVAGQYFLNSQNPVFSFVFIGQNPTERILHQRALWWKIWSGGTPPCNYTYFKELYEGGNLGTPRVAHPSHRDTSAFREWDVSIVCVKYSAGLNEEVVVLTHHEMTHDHGVYHPEIVNTSTSADLSVCANSSPAIAYVDDQLAVTWTYEDCLGHVNTSKEVAYRELNWGGVPNFSDYSTVNHDNLGSQRTSSVAGRFITGSAGYFGWYDAEQGKIGYRKSTSSTTNLKKAPTAEYSTETFAFRAFPNPMGERTIFSFEISEGESTQSLAVYDLSGRLVDKLVVSDVVSGKVELEWRAGRNIPAGIYLVNLHTDKRNEFIRITKQ